MKWRSVKADLGRALANELAIEARIAERATAYRRRKQTQAGQPAAAEGRVRRRRLEQRHGDRGAGDRPRSASCIASPRRSSELGLDIRHATVQSIGMEVVDTFYVRSATGGLVTDPFHRKEIERGRSCTPCRDRAQSGPGACVVRCTVVRSP